MTDIDQIALWATGGTKTAPSSGLYSSGYTAGSQPTGPNWNYLTNAERAKLNEVVDGVNEINDDRDGGLEGGAGNAVLCSKYYQGAEVETHQAYDIGNTGGSSYDAVDLAVWFDADNARKLLVLDSTNGTPQVHVFDAEATDASATPESSSGDLSGDLPASGAVWQACSFCCDGTSVYISLQDTNASPEVHRIQAWDVTDWGVKSGWPATGTALPGTGLVAVASFESAVEVVSGTQIATANSWFGTVTASTDAAISIIAMSNGTISGSGAGDHPGSEPSANRLTSDGSNIYYTQLAGPSICSLDISNPTAAAGSGSADLPDTVPGGNDGMDIVCTGDLIIASTDGGDMVYHSVLSEYLGYQSGSAAEFFEAGGTIAFDGVCYWLIGAVQRGTTSRPAIFKQDSGAAIYENSTTPAVMPDFENYTKATFGYDQTVAYAAGNLLAPMVFDGRNIWFVYKTGSSYPISRINKAVKR